MRIKPSLLPQEIQSSFNCFFAFSGSGKSSAAGFVLGAEEKPPTHAKVSRFARPKFSDSPPPIESPARARLSRSDFTEYFDSMNGMRSPSKSLSNLPKAGAVAMAFVPGRSSGCAAPFVLVAANAVEQIKDWIPIIGGITGRPIDERFALVTDGFRVVLDHFEFAVCDAFALFVESFRRIWERRLVVGLQLNRPAKSAPTVLRTLPTLARCGRSLSAVAFGHGFGSTKITDLASELDLVTRNPARVCDSEFVVLNLQWLDESHRVAFDLAFL